MKQYGRLDFEWDLCHLCFSIPGGEHSAVFLLKKLDCLETNSFLNANKCAHIAEEISPRLQHLAGSHLLCMCKCGSLSSLSASGARNQLGHWGGHTHTHGLDLLQQHATNILRKHAVGLEVKNSLIFTIGHKAHLTHTAKIISTKLKLYCIRSVTAWEKPSHWDLFFFNLFLLYIILKTMSEKSD